MAPSQRSTRRGSARAANRSLSPQDIAQGVSVLTQLDTQRQAACVSVVSLCLIKPEDEVDSPCPIYRSFCTNDPENPSRLTNFSHHEFERFWSQVRMHITENWNHCGKWDVVASIFRFKTGAFQKMILSFTGLVLGDNTFDHHPYARYATDVTFQQSNMPSGKMKERVAYYSAKHHLHGYKVEVSVLPNGLALNSPSQELKQKNMADESPMKDKYPNS
ncbi:hypothetical protein F442_02362 [Phytophthora nicotianae P10297]|uniref:DDE Tnp4 domain-containing protein n=1 Tax=Phytophthora nicotianae P10297 TaxID=1317064 RepID=W2ZZE1_PHYNI|nr:hypothetical protein F442_02362 [Phytophthora nicotianae P10297]